MLNNFISSIAFHSEKDFKDYYSSKTEEILSMNKINLQIEERDINIFFKIIKEYGLKILFNLNYISKTKYLFKNIKLEENYFKQFLMNQILLSFIYLYYISNQKDKSENLLKEEIRKIFADLYKIILMLYSSIEKNNNEDNVVLNLDDISNILNINIILGLNQIMNNNFFFNLSMTNLTEFIVENNNDIKDIKPFYKIFENLYTNLLMNKEILNFLKRDKNMDNFSIFKTINIASSNVCDETLKTLIFKALDLIYLNNYSNNISIILLNSIKECFYELKKNYNKNKIIKCLKCLGGQTEFIDSIFIKEEKEKKDMFLPSTYFVFDGSPFCGINYNPNYALIKKNFTLVFSFKIEENKNDLIYPLITFITENDKKDIVFNISIKNNKLYFVCEGDANFNLIEDISSNESYLIVVEFFKSMSMSLLNDKIKICVNGVKKEINSCNINYKSKLSVKLGYIPKDIIMLNNLFKNISNFSGVMGPILFFKNIIDEKDFLLNIFKLKGRYDNILFLNKNNNLDNYFFYEKNELNDEKEFKEAINYFQKISKKIDEECLFTICPLSMLNSIKQNVNFFVEDIYEKNNKKNSDELYPNFITFQIPSPKTNAAYAVKKSSSLSVFIEYDGINIYTLVIEYCYNLLRMLINKPKEEKIPIATEINNVLTQIIKSITNIIIFIKIDLFYVELDTFGFSLKKLFNLLVEIQPLNSSFVDVIDMSFRKLIDFKNKVDFNSSGKFVFHFINKFFSLICSSDYFDMSNNNNSKIFQLFIYIIKNNEQLINLDIMKGLLSFSFILDPISLDKHYNKQNALTDKAKKDYKQIKKDYKSLLKTFISQCNNFEIYINYIKSVFKENISIMEKYKLMKIYYQNHNVQYLYDMNITDKKDAIFNILKKDKNNKRERIMTKENLLNTYKKYLTKLIRLSPLIDGKNERNYELLKSVFILLIYDHQVIIPFNLSNSKNTNTNENKNGCNNIGTYNILNDILFFSNESLEKKKEKSNEINKNSSNNSLLNLKNLVKKGEDEDENELCLNFSSDENSQSFEKEEKEENSNDNTKSKDKQKYILDFILNSTSFSIYVIKAIFSCICDQWNKYDKVKFIKSSEEKFESFDMCFGEFNLFRKELLSQWIKLIEILKDETTLENSLKLIYFFMKQNINLYKANQNNKYSKSIFLHLFESKSIMNDFFDFSINNPIIINDSYKDYNISAIREINNNILSYHPRPFLFSFIKNCIKKGNKPIVKIIKNLSNFIIECLKNGNLPDLNSKCFLYFNEIRFINTLVTTFEKNRKESQNILLINDFELYHILQNLINELIKNEIMYDTKIYVFNPKCFYILNKINEKKEVKILQSSETKFLNNQIVFLNLFKLVLESSILVWISQNDEQRNGEKCAIDYISNFYENMCFNGHFITYYFDILNKFFHYEKKSYQNLKKDFPQQVNILLKKELSNNYKHYLNGNPTIQETRMTTALLFLIIMKYQSLLIQNEIDSNLEEDKVKIDNKKEKIKQVFNKLVSLAQIDLLSLSVNINKIKDDKKFEIFLEKEESKSKIFKDYNKNYYKYLLDIIIKNKNYNLENLRKELENKFIEDERENKRKELNPNKNDIKTEKKEKVRKDSFGFYNEDKTQNENVNNSNDKIDDINNKQEMNKKNIIDNDFIKLDFEDANNPILCTKRDLILKKFGYYYYKDYFKDNKFIKMKKQFLYENDPKNENNNYQGFQKLMKNKYPCIIKNFSNNSLYYPRMFLRPYKKFFDNKYFSISHSYFKGDLYNKENDYKDKILHLEYGHGLLNQPNFSLFKSVNKEDLSYNNNDNNSSDDDGDDNDDINNKNDYEDDEFENNLKIYDKKISIKTIKSVHLRNKNDFSMNRTFIEDDNFKNLNIRNTNHKKSEKQKLPINIFTTLKKGKNNNITYECELISPKDSSYGFLYLHHNFLIFQVDPTFNVKKYETEEQYLISSSYQDLNQAKKQIIIPYNIIREILYRKFMFFSQAFEIFLKNGKSYYFNLYNKSQRDEFINSLNKIIKIKKVEQYEIIENSKKYFEKNKFKNLWLDGKMSTFEYLLIINKFADRSYNVLSQYLIFPWLLTDFNEIYNKENYRNMSLPMPAQTKEGLDKILNNYNTMPKEEYKCHFLGFYSTGFYINNYLMRIYPFINNHIKCQDGKLDDPQRQLDSFQNMSQIFRDSQHDVMELIPEFYLVPEIFLNLNYVYYGRYISNMKNILINNINLGEGFNTILEFINFHHSTLNSDHFSSQINKWIDNIFGENQITDKKNVINSFPRETYEKYVKEEVLEKLRELEELKEKNKKSKRTGSIAVRENLNRSAIFKGVRTKSANKDNLISEIKILLNKTYFIGQIPSQLFKKSHPSLSTSKKGDQNEFNLSNIDNLHISLKNECLDISENDLLYIKESSNGNYFYILSEQKILVFNKLLKQANSLSINNISKINPPFSYFYNNSSKNILSYHYSYKYLIFEILECKFFFVAGYLDNSFRIYTKEKDKDIMYSIYTESRVTCIRNISNTPIFFTGHQNGKIIKWEYSQGNKDSKKENLITVQKKSSIYAHETYVKLIEINVKFEYIISTGEDGLVFIRKLYDFELLNYIKIKKNNEITDINLHNQIILISVFKEKKSKIYIYSYSLNGIKLGKMTEQLKMPISIKPDSNEIFIFGIFNIYLVKITLKEKSSLLSLTNNIRLGNIEYDNNDSDSENEIGDNFNDELRNSTPISYFYDVKNHVLFSLFTNGKLYRINLIKNV